MDSMGKREMKMVASTDGKSKDAGRLKGKPAAGCSRFVSDSLLSLQMLVLFTFSLSVCS